MRRLLPAFLLCFLCAHLLNAQTVCNYQYRKRIAFDPARVSGSSDLTDFPALIHITSDTDLETVANGGHVRNANGYDIIFTSDDGATVLDHDLEFYNAATGALTVWVKIPVLSTSINTYIYMYYGNASIGSDQSSSATWSNGFVGVWHFNNSLNNSTPTGGLNGSNNGTSNTATAKFGSARSFASASSQYVNVTPYNSAYDLTSEITVSGWVRLSSLGVDQKFAGNQDGAAGGWKFGVFTDNKIEFEIRTSGNSPFLSRSAAGGAALAANTWYYVVGQYSNSGNFIRTYRNGVLDRNYNTSATCGPTGGTMKFGREPFQSVAYLNGIMDELRLSGVTRSADWIATEYENQNSPSTFYTIHPEPKVWDGSDNVNWTTPANWTPGGAPGSGEDVIIPNAGNDPFLNTSTSIGALWIQPGAQFNNGTNSRTISVAYDILNCGTYTGNNGHLRLNTNTIQVQHLSGSGNFNLAKLIIDNQFFTSPTTKLNRIVNVSQRLTLLTGIVETDATNILALGGSATANEGSSQSFISGPISKQGTADFVFPVGKGQEWRRIGIRNITSNSTFRAEYFTSAYSNTTPVTAPLNNVSVIEYWQLDQLSGSGDARVSLYWENVAYSGIDDCNDLSVARWNGGTWVRHASTPVAGSSCLGAGTGTILTNAVVTNFSPFTFGSSSSVVNALPLTVSGFNAACDPSGVMISWTDHSPATTDRFFIERSSDGSAFFTRKEVTPESSQKKQTYTVTDEREDGLWYYRIRQRDINGEDFSTQLIDVHCDGNEGISVYPNPGEGIFTVKGLAAGTRFVVISASGQVILESAATAPETTFSLRDKGFYLLYCPGNDSKTATKIIVR